ncbi:hypothetical protein V8G54_023650 [Vigna mungo]|uniref:Uncharacterized protein n=1 Tax=Vigna mungo TaxID=3915 RepID=A0AAQ3RPE4_VIGMU
MSTSYHPETDGQTEVLNRILEQYLRSFVHAHPSHWGKYISLAEWPYNTSISATGTSSFQIIFGKHPPSIPFYLTGSSLVEAVDSLLTSGQVLLDQLLAKLEKAQLTMKEIADRHRRDVSFQVDDWVYVRLRPYRQRSLHSSITPKLTKRYYGPFRITARIGPVAYQLDLPPTTQGPTSYYSYCLPPLALDNKPIIEPLAILDTKMDSSTSPPTKLVLVQWKGLAPEDTTWEPWTVLNSDYHLEDKVPFAAVRIDSNSPISSDPNTDMMNGPNNANKGNMRDRPSRKTKMPNYLCDYITK